MKTLFAAALFAVSVAGVGAASAMPVAPSSTGSNIIHVAQGCGPGFARGPMGACHPIRGYARPAVRKCRYWGPGRRVCRTWW